MREFFITVLTLKYSTDRSEQSSTDPDHMPQNVVSDHDLRCLPLIQQFFNTSSGSKMDFCKILTQVCMALVKALFSIQKY